MTSNRDVEHPGERQDGHDQRGDLPEPFAPAPLAIRIHRIPVHLLFIHGGSA